MNSCRIRLSSGSAMVEFAIVLPILALLIFGIIELGRALYQQQVLTDAALAASRYMSRSYGAVDTTTCATVNTGTPEQWNTAVARAKTLAVTGKTVSGFDVGDVTIQSISQNGYCIIRVAIAVQFMGIFGNTLIPLTNIGSPTLRSFAESIYIGE